MRYLPLIVTGLLLVGDVYAATVDVSSRQNIFGSGLGSGPEVIGDGLSPILAATFEAGSNQVLTFSSVTGTVNYYGGSQPSTESPDGYGPSFQPYAPGSYPTAAADFPGFMGLSALRDTNNASYLVGVFLTDTPPSDPAPPTLDFSNNKAFSTLSPQIAQLFFIGDGLTATGTGDSQQFLVPPTATRLFLGFIDSQFVDNLGSLTATFEIVPEPSTIASLGVLLLLAGAGKGRRHL